MNRLVVAWVIGDYREEEGWVQEELSYPTLDWMSPHKIYTGPKMLVGAAPGGE